MPCPKQISKDLRLGRTAISDFVQSSFHLSRHGSPGRMSDRRAAGRSSSLHRRPRCHDVRFNGRMCLRRMGSCDIAFPWPFLGHRTCSTQTPLLPIFSIESPFSGGRPWGYFAGLGGTASWRAAFATRIWSSAAASVAGAISFARAINGSRCRAAIA